MSPIDNTAEDKISWIEDHESFMNYRGYFSVQFHISGNSTQYLAFSHIELYFRVKIKKGDGKALHETKQKSCLIIDMILQTMFSSTAIRLNHTLLRTQSTNYMYKVSVDNLFNYKGDAKKILMNAIGFSGDSGNFHYVHCDKYS